MRNSKSLTRSIFSLLTLSVLVSFIGVGCVAPRSAQVVETSYEASTYPRRSSLYLSLHHKKKHYYKKPVCKKSYSHKKKYYKKSYSHKKRSYSRSRSRRR